MEQLIQEYLDTALRLEEYREQLRQERSTTRGEASFLLEKRILLLGEEIRDLMYAADWMRRYYRKGN